MSTTNSKLALRAYLDAHLTPEQVKEVSGLVAKLCVAAVTDDRQKRGSWTAEQLTKFADVFFNGRPA